MRMKLIVGALASVVGVAVFGLPVGEKTYLWPEGKMPDAQGHQIAATVAETRAPGFDAARSRAPHLQWYPAPNPQKKTGACVIVLSGGSYSCCCDLPAFEPLVRRLLDEGVACVNLTYRTPRPKGLPIYQSAWEDGQRAVRLVRSLAQARGYDPEKIGVMGCSAGSPSCSARARSRPPTRPWTTSTSCRATSTGRFRCARPTR